MDGAYWRPGMAGDTAMKIKPEHAAVAVLVVAAGGLGWFGVRKAGGLPLPKSPVTEGLAFTSDLSQPNLIRPELAPGGAVYTKHRYPDRCGGEVSTVIHFGHSRLAVPNTEDSHWITAPPSEATI